MNAAYQHIQLLFFNYDYLRVYYYLVATELRTS